MDYIAHKRENSDEVQTVKEHCLQTAQRSRDFAVDLFKDICYEVGLLHDAGKYRQGFQKRINGVSNEACEHAIVGCRYCDRVFQNEIVSNLAKLCIAGHHTGIPDSGSRNNASDYGPDLQSRLNKLKNQIEQVPDFENDIKLEPVDSTAFLNELVTLCNRDKGQLIELYAFAVRYVFSCLTDADSLDTAEFMTLEKNRSIKSDFEFCLNKVNERLNSFSKNQNATSLQKARASLQAQVFEKTDEDSEIYLMNMPTGSGKTLCSIKFALERAIKKKKDRIIYVIPYNSIIDQTAKEFEDLFGDKAQLLRHQSTFGFEDLDEKDEDYKKTYEFATENWDAGLIVTTAVQFFESLYANKRRRLRKVHNMANSIIVFDEAHLMPSEFLQPCLRSIAYVTKMLNSEAVFLTATMPDFKSLMTKYALKTSVIKDLVEDRGDFDKFKKCRYSSLGEISDETLVQKARQYPSALIVVSTKKGAKTVFELCDGNKFYLTTNLTPLDREQIIKQIKYELKKLEDDFPKLENVPDNRRITVVSTSLIEAGVDLDFYTVFRELAGLDNILQSGGRCNREGKRRMADVFVFRREENSGNKERDCENAARGIFQRYDDISSVDAIEEYYKILLSPNVEDIGKHSLSRTCEGLMLIDFATYAKDFKLIDDENSVSVVVPQDETSKKLVEEMKHTGFAKTKKLQKYCASVKCGDFKNLLEQHAVTDFGTGVYCLVNPSYYDAETGIQPEGKDIYF